MKKLFITVSFFGLFILIGNTISAQASKAIVLKIDTNATLAIMTINDDKSLKDTEKQKYIQRIEAFSNSAKKYDDGKAIEVFEAEYNRISENYNRITGNSLPKLKSELKKEK